MQPPVTTPFPLLIRTVCADALEKCQPTCHAAVSALTNPPPPPAFLLTLSQDLQFLCVLGFKNRTRINCNQLSFKSPVRKLIALWGREVQGIGRDHLWENCC